MMDTGAQIILGFALGLIIDFQIYIIILLKRLEK